MTAPSSRSTQAPSIGAGSRATSRVPFFTAEAWAPLKVELFRNLWIATSIAQIGTWTREAAGPTLMENLTEHWATRPEMVARVLVFSNLPIFLFSVVAGALADVLDRRQLLIVTQVWMVIVSMALGLLTYTGHITPAMLLVFTFLLGVGTAAFGPALQAVLPELVPRQHFALAINMNSIALNVARAVGPALFILVVWFVPGNPGAGVSFMLTAASFVVAIWVLVRWKRPPQRAAVHGEETWNAIRAGFRYTVNSPANRAILLRVLTFIVPAVVIWSQVPIIASDQLHIIQATGTERAVELQRISALLFAFVGSGAILGVFLMPGLHARYSIDPVVNVCTAFFAVGLIVLSYVHVLWLAAIILIFLGINWVIIPTNFNTATQKSVPVWVKGRAISFYLTILFGSFALGGAIWGHVTHFAGIHASLLWGGLSMLGMLSLAKWFPLTINEGKDLAPAHPVVPTHVAGAEPVGPGAVQLAVRYRVPTHRSPGFRDLLQDLRRTRLRNGAYDWRAEQSDSNGLTTIREVITFASWQEYTRSFSRATKWDVMLEAVAREYVLETESPALAEPGPRRVFPPIPFLSGSAISEAPAAWPGTLPSLSSRYPAGIWLSVRLSNALDRAIDEMFVIYDRLFTPPKRKTAWRNVQVHVPTTEVQEKQSVG
jgi:MFS family permease